MILLDDKREGEKQAMRSTKRALRRSQRQNKIKRAQQVYAALGMSDTEMQQWALRNHKHLKKCSCWMCGHRRKWEGLTMQERRSLLSLKDDYQAAEQGAAPDRLQLRSLRSFLPSLRLPAAAEFGRCAACVRRCGSAMQKRGAYTHTNV